MLSKKLGFSFSCFSSSKIYLSVSLKVFRLLVFLSTHVSPLPSKLHINSTNYAIAKEKEKNIFRMLIFSSFYFLFFIDSFWVVFTKPWKHFYHNFFFFFFFFFFSFCSHFYFFSLYAHIKKPKMKKSFIHFSLKVRFSKSEEASKL